MSKLYYIFSAMNAGKTAELIQKSHKYVERNLEIRIMTSEVDTRYEPGTVTSRIGLSRPAITIKKDSTKQIDELLDELEDTRYGIEEFINVTKYERPSERNGGAGACKAAGNFPVTIPKTDEDRVQNLFTKYKNIYSDVEFARSLKLDGSSTTLAYFSNPEFYVDKVHTEICEYNADTDQMEVVETIPYPHQYDDCQIVLCSRNLALKYDADNHFWKAIHKDDIITRFKDYCSEYDLELAIQGETMGPGIQGNRENLTEHQFFAFRVWDIKNRKFLPYHDFIELCEKLQIQTVPQLGIVKFFELYDNVKDALASADHESINHKIAEGDVYVSTTPINGVTVHFKVINNKFLLKCED